MGYLGSYQRSVMELSSENSERLAIIDVWETSKYATNPIYFRNTCSIKPTTVKGNMKNEQIVTSPAGKSTYSRLKIKMF